MRKAVWLSFAALGTLGVLAAGCGNSPQSTQGTQSHATTHTHTLSAQLDPRHVVSPTSAPRGSVPAELAHAHGAFAGVLDTRSHTMSWKLTYAGLGKPTVVIADVHYGKPGQFGALLVRLCGPCRSARPSGTVTLGASAVPAVLAGDSWVTILTNSYPNGAIRGQIVARDSGSG